MDLIDAIRAIDKPHEDDILNRLYTVWGEHLDKNKVLKEYPRPQFQRDSYYNLNGEWEYCIVSSEGNDLIPDKMDGTILVPFSPESILSGVERRLEPYQYLWYKKSLPSLTRQSSDSRFLLHFGAVDQFAEIYINSEYICSHSGGYLPFTIDITDHLVYYARSSTTAHNTLHVRVKDTTDSSFHSRGKQTLKRGGMYYTAQSGIWQTVWIEEVPATYIREIKITPESDLKTVSIEVSTNQPTKVTVKIPGHEMVKCPSSFTPKAAFSGDGQFSSDTYPSNETSTQNDPCFYQFKFSIDAPHLWSPENPYLYPLQIDTDDDHVRSYFAMRYYSIEKDSSGISRFCLNHKPYFLMGVLDQGYWPDGLYTAPSDDALIFDITEMKRLHFNMLRKHIKVEAARWYYHCDRLGMIVWQDMVSGGSSYAKPVVSYLPTLFPNVFGRMPDGPATYKTFSRGSAEGRKEWIQEMKNTIRYLYNVPSIASWVLFNEGWGQFNAASATIVARELDDTRPIDQASGWFDEGSGDYRSVHNYFRPLSVEIDKNDRAFVISEYGGFTLHMDGHSSVDRVYGYKKYDTLDELGRAYYNLINGSIKPLISKGLAGAVYTQLSDVEEEVNGLITYDRRITKINPDLDPNMLQNMHNELS
ncbi:glycoside hydrolase family 2 protein [Butyrivibrio sp. YAB3001]|uniref:glycoside hydrolase family 2 protein n=1 Tax=Butyrivibrio sp. YAB3001 TaxID=1520812 RepID=UPI0008F66602|nr:glycoside hydrolase family 2 TIM barrel-domain containing protein [Butyrivibrio sp. YAB3001]SFC20330.1 Glycosyl hydrolases family 2, TIM barrel domain [Butyrivibrio sp. YAB3001]